jgi:hypothetical protein
MKVCQRVISDTDMQSAIEELRQAEEMFNNATLGWRQIEANYRISAAQARINAIRTERGDNSVETNA